MSTTIPEGVELPRGVESGEYETEHAPQDYTYAKPKEETEHGQDQ